MILTEIYGNIQDIPDLQDWHVETALVKSDDLLKSILRVTSDHGRDYGIRLEDEGQKLENGTAFFLSPGKLLVLNVIPDEVIVIQPADIDEMGKTAHMLGNLHKPVQIQDGRITLLYDPVVAKTLKENGTAFHIEKIQLDQPMRYVDLTAGGHSHVHHHDHAEPAR
ncbi:MAG: urease accessory protein UreE [Bilifractor sp.]